MYFIIFVISWYLTIWVAKSYKGLSSGMNSNGQYIAHAIWGTLVHGVKGFNLGYTVWFIWYCIHNYPYDLF